MRGRHRAPRRWPWLPVVSALFVLSLLVFAGIVAAMFWLTFLPR